MSEREFKNPYQDYDESLKIYDSDTGRVFILLLISLFNLFAWKLICGMEINM